MIDNTNLVTPDFGVGFPSYPDLEQLCRVSGSAFAGTSPAVYPAFVQQFSPPLSLRDREPSYVVEPNRVVLGAGIYDCRLIGAFPTAGHSLFGVIPQLPLYASTCCVSGGFSSSSGSIGSATSANTGISFANVGTYSNTTPTTSNTAFTSVPLAAGEKLIVIVATTGVALGVGVDWGGITLNLDLNAGTLPGGLSIGGSLLAYSLISSGGTADVHVTFSLVGANAGVLAIAVRVVGVSDQTDQVISNSGTATNPFTGTTSFSTDAANEFLIGFDYSYIPVGSPSYDRGFSANQTVSITVHGNAYKLSTATQIVNVVAQYRTTDIGITAAQYVAGLTTHQ